MRLVVLAVIRPLQMMLVLVLAGLWSFNFPNHQVSDLIGAHFPWPAEKSWKWHALLVEGVLVQAAVCLPVVFLLAFTLRRAALAVATLLASIFFARALFELPYPINPPFGTAFLLYLVMWHVVFLVGGTALTRRRLERMRSNVAIATDAHERPLPPVAPTPSRRSFMR